MRLKLYWWDLFIHVFYTFFLQFHNLQELRHSASLVTKVFIQRDYSDGTVCRFLTKFPSELDNRVSAQNTQCTKKKTHCISTWNSVRVFLQIDRANFAGGDGEDAELLLCGGREDRRSVLPGRMSGVRDGVHHLPLHGDALWEGKNRKKKTLHS